MHVWVASSESTFPRPRGLLKDYLRETTGEEKRDDDLIVALNDKRCKGVDYRSSKSDPTTTN